MLMTTLCASVPANEFTQALPDPVRAYQDYRDAIRRRDVDAVFGALTERAGRSLRECGKFRALFETWCASQDEPAAVLASTVAGDAAVVDLRGPTSLIRAGLEWDGERWLVASDQYTPLHKSTVDG